MWVGGLLLDTPHTVMVVRSQPARHVSGGHVHGFTVILIATNNIIITLCADPS